MKHIPAKPHLVFRTFLALASVGVLVGGIGGFVLLAKVRQTYIDLQFQANRQQAERLANLLENRLARGVAPEVVVRDLQGSLESLPRDESGFYCLFGEGGRLLCHPDPEAVGMSKKADALKGLDNDSRVSIGDLMMRKSAGGGLLENQMFGGATQIVYSQPVAGTPWQVNVHTNLAVIEARSGQLWFVILGTLVPSLLALVGLGAWSARRVSKAYETQLETANLNLGQAVEVTQKTNLALAQARRETEREKANVVLRNQEVEAARTVLEERNRELDQKIAELEASNQQADRIFSALAKTLPGTVLDTKYRLERVIGTGGFGAVYAATQLNLNKPVAVKVFRPSPGNDSAAAAERFRREAVTASRVNHPNAISILDSNVSGDGISYLVMELLDGVTLADELKLYGRFPLARCVNIIVPTCLALAAAHASGVIHRDIKPDNIFLHRSTLGETVKVLDFGIARLIDSEGKGNVTETGLVIGTPSYMSPERILGQPFDEKADVYALGVLLYEMLSGLKPFPGPFKNIGAVMEVLKSEVTPLHRFLPNLPDEVEDVVMRAISRDPETRPTATEMAEVLNRSQGIETGKPSETPTLSTRLGVSETPTLLDPLESGRMSSEDTLEMIVKPPKETTLTYDPQS